MEANMTPEIRVPVHDQSALGSKGFFFVGGSYKGEAGKHFYSGQMYVEVYVPKNITRPYPLIFFHGAGQTNLNWLSTPDGREGWADYFLRRGFVVYLAEQPARGRSAYHPAVDGKTTYHTVEDIEGRFAGTTGNWKNVGKHSQWPEEASKIGTPLFDQFAAAQVEFVADAVYSQQQVFAAAGELLEKTGPAILVTHSQAGPFGWKIGDEYPELVKGIIALEPAGPVFSRNTDGRKAENFGLCSLPMHFDPPVDTPEDFVLERLHSENPEEVDCLVMAPGHIHRLPRLAKVPVLLLTGEASYHTMFDYATAKMLEQCGVCVDFVRLEQAGFEGNGHFLMLEKNSLEIASYILDWIGKKIG